MNTLKLFFAFVIFSSYTIVANAQNQEDINYDNSSLTISKIEFEQTQSILALEDQNINVSNTTKTNTATGTNTNSYVFNFNHLQFLKLVFSKSAYC